MALKLFVLFSLCELSFEMISLFELHIIRVLGNTMWKRDNDLNAKFKVS